MEELFNFPRNEVTKTNVKGSVKHLKKEEKKELKISIRDENCDEILKDLGGFPKEKEFFAIKTNGETDAGSFFTYALKNWEEITEMYLATWTISKQNIKRIKNALISGKLKHLTFVFSSTLKGANPSLYANLMLNLKGFKGVVELKEINSHAKTFSLSNGKDFITVSGSANWSENPRIENYLILNDKDLFNHHKEWMQELSKIE